MQPQDPTQQPVPPQTPQPAAPVTPLHPFGPALQSEPQEMPAASPGQLVQPGQPAQSPTPPGQPAPPVYAQPVPQVTPQQAAFMNPNTVPAPIVGSGSGNRKKWLMPVVIISVLLTIFGGSAAAYYLYYVPSRPQNILARAMANMLSPNALRSGSVHGTYNVSDGNLASGTLTGTLAGTFSGSGFDMQVGVGMNDVKASLEVLTKDGQTAYARLSGLKSATDYIKNLGLGDTIESYTTFVQPFDNQWVLLNKNTLSSVATNTSLDCRSRMSSDDRQQLSAAYRRHPFMTIPKKFPDEKVSGANSYHYQVRVDQNQLAAFLQEVKGMHLRSLPLSGVDPEVVKSSKLSKYPFDVWIAKGDLIVNRIRFTASDDGSTISGDVRLDEINKPVTIKVPQNAKTPVEILKGTAAGSALSQLFLSAIEDASASPAQR